MGNSYLKKGQSRISLVLLILIALVSLAILWNIVVPLVENKTGEINIDKFSTPLDIKEAIFFVNGASKITLNRGAGEGEITSLKFVFYDDKGNTHVETKDSLLIGELETKTYNFGPIPLDNVKDVLVVPFFGDNPGLEYKSNFNDLLQVPSSLVSWWRFNEDFSDFLNQNNCENTNLIEDYRKAALFDSIPIKCGNNPGLDMNGDMAISFWIKTNQPNGIILNKGDNYKVYLQNSKIFFNYQGNDRPSNANIDDNSWHHVAVTMLATYIDGIPDSVLEISGASNVNTDNLVIGEFSGELDDVMLFNSSLSNNQVLSIFNSQKSG